MDDGKNYARKGHHTGEVQVLMKYKVMVLVLVTKYRLCMCCVYRTLMFISPKIYHDAPFTQALLREFLREVQKQPMQALAPFIDEFTSLAESGAIINAHCWLCSGMLQPPYLDNLLKELVHKMTTQHYTYKYKIKLTVRIHNLFIVKHQILCYYMLEELKKYYDESMLQCIRKQIVEVLFDKNALDLKSVLKWLLSHRINELEGSRYNSTIGEDEDTVIVGVEVEAGEELSGRVTEVLGPVLHFDVARNKQHKKVKIDLSAQEYHANWTNNTIGKLSALEPQHWLQIIQAHPTFLQSLQALESRPTNLPTQLTLSSPNIYLCGYYVKFSRYLSQTPWLVNNKKLTESSIQDEIQHNICEYVYEGIEDIEVKFHAGGREDIDVRMLKGGRPFVLELVSPRKKLTDISIQELEKKISHLTSTPVIPAEHQSEELVVRYLERIINASTSLLQVSRLQKTTAGYISNELKAAESEKIKHYVCVINSPEPITEKDKEILDGCGNLEIEQKTPIRVLHRRTLMYRKKYVHKMEMHLLSRCSAVLEIWASAGTYIKEFVHGDLNRTLPNVGTLLQKPIDILQLDVGSLKEGQWEEGAHKQMRLGQLPWE